MWAVNIKKGVLSALQNSMDNFEIEHKGKEVGNVLQVLVYRYVKTCSNGSISVTCLKIIIKSKMIDYQLVVLYSLVIF